MPPPSRDPHAQPGVLLVGPGVRARDLGLVLEALATPRGVEVRVFGDVSDLALDEARAGILLLDVDATPLEDVGYVRRFLGAHARIEIVLLGADARARTARVLGPQRFAHWPPDVDELALLVAAAGGAPTTSHAIPHDAARSRRPTPSTSTAPSAISAEGGDLEQVRAILEDGGHDMSLAVPLNVPSSVPLRASLDVPPTATAPTPLSPVAGSAREFDAAALVGDVGDFEPEAAFDTSAAFETSAAFASSAAFESSAVRRGEIAADVDDEVGEDAADALDAESADAPRSAITAPPWWRAQVADLADAAQRIDLSVKMLAQAAPEIDEGDLDEARARLRDLENEVARLLQFTRTLGYVAAPPPAGSQTFDLGEIVHLFAAGLAQSGPEAPRCQYKTTPGAAVRSDRQLLSQALDAVFFLVRCTSRKGELVRAQVQRVDDDGRAWVEMVLDFPSGPIEGFSEDDVVSPYGLSDLFPELGPNALAAAAGIVAGQGGRLSLVNRAARRMTWTLRLPRAGV